MAVTIKEKPDSPTFDVNARGGGLTRSFMARGTDDAATLYAAILTQIELVYDGFICTGIKTPRKYAGGLWDLDVEYGDPAERGSGSGGTPVGETPSTPTEIPGGSVPLNPVSQGLEFTFDCSTETEHITKSLGTRSRHRRDGGTPTDYKGAINVGPDGKVGGCDRLAAKSEFTITTKRPDCTLDYYRTLRDMTTRLNHEPWGGFDYGEVIYLGCNGQGAQRGEWTFSHRFASSPNEAPFLIYDPNSLGDHWVVTNAADAGKWTIPFKGGWDYIWVVFEADPDTTTGGLPLPAEAHVEVIYKSGDFADLELGV